MLAVYPQGEAANWYFGFGAGIRFDQASGNINVVDDGQLFTNEGCSSISDSEGNLLFYTDGITVYNALHNIMQNGTGLFGDPSSTQSGIIVPKPLDPDIYYIFTVDVQLQGETVHNGFSYSEVDMSMDGGLGAVTVKNVNLLTRSSEKISAVLKDCVDESVWIVTFASATGAPGPFDTYHAFEVSSTGINTNSVKSTFPITITDVRGYLKLSPDGTKMACANMDGIFQTGIQDDVVYLYDFDAQTGIVSNQQTLAVNTASPSPYGLEFSPNNRFLYVHSSNNFIGGGGPEVHASSLTQFDLQAADIQNSQFLIDQRQLYRGGLQLGPDGKIYRALSATYFMGIPFLGVINNPNELGAACNYAHAAIDLFPNTSSQGLPPFNQALFNLQIDIIQNGISTTNLDLCTGDTYTLTGDDLPGATYTWIKDGVVLAETNFELDITDEGHYELFIDPNNGECAIEGQAFVSYYDLPVANTPTDIIICDNDDDGIYAFDFSDTTAEIMGGQDASTFRVKYYNSLLDADADTNELILPYFNATNPEQIFARIENVNYGGCYDTTSFMVEVFEAAVANPLPDIEVCDDLSDGDNMNGQSTTDLGALIPQILNGQDPALFDVSFHSSLANAENGNSPLPLNYYNSVPDVQEIFVRVVNVNSDACFDTTSFLIIINRIPEAFNSALFQCDEDGNPDGFTLFNLTEADGELTGGVSDLSTEFYLTLADAQNGTNQIDGSNYSNITPTQVIHVRVVNDISGCWSLSTLTLDVTATDTTDTFLTLCDDDGNEDGFQTFDLANAEAAITANIPDQVLLKYYASYEDALLEVNELPNSYVNEVPYNQTLYVRVENDNACYGISELQLVVYELPNIETEQELIYCLNTYPETVTIDAALLSGNINDFSYDWSTGDSSYSIDINETGVYTVLVTNADGCSKLRTITVIPSNIATIESIEVVDVSTNNSITVFVSGEGDYEFALDDINGPYQDSNFFDNVAPGFHTVYVRDKNGCGIVEETVSVIGFPKFFTPNGDSYNDTWQVLGVDQNFQSNSIIYIYDRYGKLLVQVDPRGPGWDGTYNGKLMPTNDYWFHVTLQDGRMFTSHFTLKR